MTLGLALSLFACNVLISQEERDRNNNPPLPTSDTGMPPTPTTPTVPLPTASTAQTGDTAVVYSDLCPQAGLAAVDVVVVNLPDPPLGPKDTILVGTYAVFPGVQPDFVWAAPGAKLKGPPYRLPFTAHDVGNYTPVLCLDRSSDNAKDCGGKGDVSGVGSPLAFDKDSVATLTWDATAKTLAETSRLPVSPDCP